MNLKQIQELIKFVAKSGATEVDLEMGDVKISIKSPPKGKVIPDSQTIINPVSSQLESKSIESKSQIEDSNSEANEESAENHIVIKSPIIGTFYRRPSPDKDPFVNVGDKIDPETVVGIVEAMKLFNEIEAEVSGTIIKVLVDDMAPVEYDHPLFLVDPN